MIPDGTYTAVVDRLDEGLATLELTRDDERYNFVVGTEELPEEGAHVDAVLELTLVDESLEQIVYDADETAERKSDAQDRFDQLSRRPSDTTDK
jgi:hypothetical protein